MKMRKRILEVLLGSLKAKIVTSIVAISLVGGAVTADVIYKNSIDQSNKKEVSLESNLEDISKETKENIYEKEDETLDNSGKATEEKASTNESEDQKVTTSNEGGNNGGSAEPSSGSSSNNGGTTNSSKGSEAKNESSVNPTSGNGTNNAVNTAPTQQTKPVVNVGIDWTMTNKLNNLVVEYTATYKGIKKSELTEIAKQVSLSQISTADAINKISSMSWEEEGTNINTYLSPTIQKIATYSIGCTKFNVSGDISPEDISLNNRFNLGQFGSVFAYRNSDNSLTITSLGCQFVLSARS
ncbi:hypothetical protein [Clostridium intestinale]|uniref:Uncharacterized protein n=1 Tax=Clostridium intestinale TaxID=36845 RepID=A0A7D6ZIN9_9CLOT|nr:hypothetical protein [Clostridium intestinale]QLY81481.1 hypothetical protein HZF06_07820 [Clostridium intestinale]